MAKRLAKIGQNCYILGNRQIRVNSVMKKTLAGLVLAAFTSFSTLAVELDFYLPNETFDKEVTVPESVLGYQVGDWHVRHDQMVQYFKQLAASSDRVSIETIGYSHEQRELLHLVITSPQNHKRLEQIRTTHLNRFNSSSKPNADDHPLVVSLNYSVHGDESSGANASLLVAYYLAASNDPKVLEYLDNMVIIVDPVLNPDGLSRFAQWANQHKGKNLNKDAYHREHVQDWVRGRVNHYWFDLNRDWLLLQHPESRARIAKYHQWRPNVLTDHHEMGTHSTFFFQPGIPSRKNPHTPEENVELTKTLAHYHADAFDKTNTLYFTEESFDDFYAGKGSTYPDLHGTIGILFEQGSSRGHLQESINGDVDFPSTIKNQVTASFSTLEGSLAHKKALLDFQWRFEREAIDIAKDADIDGFVVGGVKDKTRLEALLKLLSQHQISAFPLTKNVKLEGKSFATENSVYIPLAQPQVRLIQSIFSEQTSFNDNTFYDVSSWNLAMAFNIEFAEVESKRAVRFSKQAWQPVEKTNQEMSGSYSFAIDWYDFDAAKLSYRLLQNGIVLRAAMKPFTAKTAEGQTRFDAGTIVVNAGLQKEGWLTKFNEVVTQFGVKVTPIDSGLTSVGIDLGSRNMEPIKLPHVLVVGGHGTNLYEVGETWYVFDRHVGFSPTIIDKRRLGSVDLSKYTHIVLTDGQFKAADESLAKELAEWTRNGGILWAQKRAAMWLADQEILRADTIKTAEMKKRFDDKGLRYDQKEVLAGKQRIAGAFFNSRLDLSHPMAFGFSNDSLPLFKNRTDLLLEPDLPFTLVAKYEQSPLAAGYAHATNVERISGASGMIAHRLGKGTVIGMTDNPNFRAIMYGTQRLLFNALFMAQGVNN